MIDCNRCKYAAKYAPSTARWSNERELQEAALSRNTDLAVELLRKQYTATVEVLLTSGRFE